MTKHRKKVVCFGGGNAMPKTVLTGLRKYPVDIYTIVSMLESGGSSAQFRIDFNVLPAGDVRRHLLTLSEAPDWKKDLFALRVGREIFDGGHKGHAFGNIFISGLEYILKDFEKTLDIAHEFLEVRGKVLPATIEKGHIYAVLENEEVIFGEDEIDVPMKHNPNLKIKELLLTKKLKAYAPAMKAITDADAIIIGPGDLYSSLIPCFLPEGMTRAMKKSKAKKIFICNAMTKLGETNDFSVLDFTREMEKYASVKMDHVIYNTSVPAASRIAAYRKSEPSTLEMVKIDKNPDRKKFIGSNILIKQGPIFHDPKKLVKIITSLI